MLEILMYLFKKFMDNDANLTANTDAMTKELEQVGFSSEEIKQAFNWLDGLHAIQCYAVNLNSWKQSRGMRYYIREEIEKLGMEGVSFLRYLERLSMLDNISREVVIDRLMVFEDKTVPLGHIKWVVLFVLFHQPDQRYSLSVLQEMVLCESADVVH